MTHRRIFTLLLGLAMAIGTVVAPAASAATIDHSSPSSWLRIVDVSSYQCNITYGQLSRAGIYGGYIKATEGTGYANSCAAAQRAGFASVGLPFGGYDFATPSNDPIADARFFVASGGATGTFTPVLDLEQSSGRSADAVVVWSIAWSNEVYRLTGRRAMLYTGGYYGWSHDPRMVMQFPDLWIANYPLGYQKVPGDSALSVANYTIPTGAWSGWSAWQFTSMGNIDGISGRVDVSAVSPKWWATQTGAAVEPPNTPIGPGKKTRYPAAVYRPGSTGTGVQAIQRLVGATPDGIYGPATAAAVAHFQCNVLHVSPCDGVWGPVTKAAADKLQEAAKPSRVSKQCASSYLTLRSSGACVMVVQKLLGKRGYHLTYDGAFGPATLAAVRAFQASKHLAVDGVVGPHTWAHLA